MHEFSIGDGIVRATMAELAKLRPPPRALLKARVVVGALRQIVPDSLVFAYELLTQNTPAMGSRLEIVSKPITARCRACGWTGEIHSPLFRCNACQTGNIEVLTGNELYLDSLEIEEP